ncbi:NAD-dependent epimerase/dehydratase family protein [Streptomyces sp. PTM05]|uniref:NAD-dependent epimerase/dehydratase family protein n=1 Tax=Streptantibioticus parmotrematis TaxID=2873249 RepID=A0ABS7QUT1_9ACTN|nr:NAD-dependent epimerase/dehydratase family protein [Streptantibioticus parmotrematis]MBY8886429.1 NAD-dependent epimerase/dehydratase family protein [Streptantibioticus parmotrematis]
MDIVGNGFLARSLAPLSDRHHDTVVLAAGVSWASGTSAADFRRESDLLAEVAARCKAGGRRLLFFSTSSSGMYGRVTGPAEEDTPVVPCTPYGHHKLAMERQLAASGADHLVLRLGHLVGPGQPPHQLLPMLVSQIRAGRVEIHRGAARDLIAVDDTVTVIDHLLARAPNGEVVNVASGNAVPVERVVDRLERRLGTRARREYRDAGARHTISIHKLRTLVPEVAGLGFGPDYHLRAIDAFPLDADPSTAQAPLESRLSA